MLTTEFILVELGSHFSLARERAVFGGFVKRFQADQLHTVISASSDLFEAGLALYLSRHDKSWSLTDCSSFEVMRQHDLQEALTFDHHFLQAGFQMPLLN